MSVVKPELTVSGLNPVLERLEVVDLDSIGLEGLIEDFSIVDEKREIIDTILANHPLFSEEGLKRNLGIPDEPSAVDLSLEPEWLPPFKAVFRPYAASAQSLFGEVSIPGARPAIVASVIRRFENGITDDRSILGFCGISFYCLSCLRDNDGDVELITATVSRAELEDPSLEPELMDVLQKALLDR